MSSHAISRPLLAGARGGALRAAWFTLTLLACSREVTTKVDSPSQQASPNPGFALEPARPDEQFDLAMRYESGNGVDGDDAWTEYWAWRAALQGHEPARDWLRRRANTEPLDQSTAVVIDVLGHLRKKAHPTAQLWLALAGPGQQPMSESRNEAVALLGQGFPAVREKALRGDVWAKYLVGAVHEFAFAELPEALRWYTEAAERGNVLAQDSLGHMYDEGRGTSTDSGQALRWFQTAADQGYARSQAMLGWLHENGRGVAQNSSEALRWYRKAADQGMTFAKVRVSALEGRKSPPDLDPNASPSALARVAVAGNAEAQFRLASMYDRGQGLNKNEAEAARWYKRAAEQNHLEAQVRLAKLYESGLGVAQDRSQALEWYERAARGGDADAKKRISQVECERSATTRALGVLLRCADRASLQSALRSAGLRVVREDSSGGTDVYEGTALLDAPHTVKVTYSSQGQFVSLVHELPSAFDAKMLKKVISDLTTTYGAPASPAAQAGETRQKWALGDGMQVEVVRTKTGADSYVAFRTGEK